MEALMAHIVTDVATRFYRIRLVPWKNLRP